MKIKFNVMRKFILILIFATLSCKGQEVKKIDLSGESEMNYIFARISDSKPNSKWLYISLRLFYDHRIIFINYIFCENLG